jgi:hypothetical protein
MTHDEQMMFLEQAFPMREDQIKAMEEICSRVMNGELSEDEAMLLADPILSDFNPEPPQQH